MDVGDLLLLDTIIAEGGITAAAVRLGQPKTTVSRRLRRLEGVIGAPLFDRAGRRLRPTALAGRFAEPAAAMRVAFAQAQSLAESVRSGEGSELRVSTPYLFGRLVMAPVVARLLSGGRQTRVQLVFRNDPVDPLREGMDMAVRVHAPTEPYLVRLKLAGVALRLFAPSRVAQSIRGPDDLRHLPFVQTANAEARQVTLRLTGGAAPVDIPLAVLATVNDPEAACGIALENNCFAALPGFVAAPHVLSGRLRPVLPELCAGNVEIFATFPPGRARLAPVRRLMAEIRRDMRALPFGA